MRINPFLAHRPIELKTSHIENYFCLHVPYRV